MAGDFEGLISYSRRASGGLASDLQSAVERFAKPWYQLQAVRIFRDDATMSANVALWPAIEAALAKAEWLITADDWARYGLGAAPADLRCDR